MRRMLFATAAVVALAACNDQPAGQSGGSTEAENASTSAASTAPRRAREARDTTSDDAVQGLYLAQSGSGRISFASSETNGGEHVLTDVVIAGDDGDGEEVRVERIRLLGAYMDGETPNFDRLIFENLTVESDDDEGAMRIASISVDEPNAPMAQLLGRFLSNDDVEDWDDDHDFGKFTDYAFGSFSIEGVALDIEEDGEPVKLELGRLALDDLNAGRLGAMTLSDLNFEGVGDEGEEVKGSLESASFAGVDASVIDLFANLGENPSESAFQQALSDSGLTNPFAKHYDSVALKGLDFSVDGVFLSLDEAESVSKQTRGGIETTGSFGPLKLTVDDSKKLGGQAKQGLQMLGYDEIEIEGRSVQMADELNDRIYSREHSVTLKDGFTIEADYDIGGVGEYTKRAAALGMADFDSFDGADMNEIKTIYEPLIINKLELRLVDDSIVERGINLASTMSGMTPEQTREQANAMLSMGAMFVPEGAAQGIALDAIAAAREFLANPGTLTIAVDSDDPVAVGELMAIEDPNELATKLPVKVTASR